MSRCSCDSFDSDEAKNFINEEDIGMNSKKVLSLVLALAMMFSLATPVYALESAADDLDSEEPAVVETVDDVTEEEPAETPEEIPTETPEEIPTDPPADDLGEVTDPDPAPADDPADEVKEEDDLSIMSEEAEEEEEIEIQGDDNPVYVAQIGEVKYESLAEAFAAAQANDRIVVLKDCEIESITVNKAVKLDLAGFKVSSEVPELFLVGAAGDLTITGNGRITGPQNGEAFDSKTLITVDAGKLTIEDGTLTATGAGSNGMYGVYALNGGTAIFGKEGGSGPVITSYFAAIGKNHMTGPATITIYGGTYTANAEPTGNEWWSYFCAPIYAAASGTITIEGGTFNGYYGISDRYADVEQTLTINGGTFNAKSGIDVFVREVSGSGGTANRTIKATFDTLRVPEGYKWVADGVGVYKLVMNEYTAAIVDAMIDAIEEPVTLESAGAIMNARDAYESLTEAEKNQVQNRDKLERVEAELASLQAESALAEGIKLNHEYVILNEGDQLQLSVLNLNEIGNVPIEWSVENDKNEVWAYDEDLINVDDGQVTALRPFELDGKLITTAYVRAAALGKDGVYHYARCRVDIMADDLGDDLSGYGVRLIDTKVKVPLLLTDYASVRVQLTLKQDIVATMADGDEPEPIDLTGDAAIQSAVFANREASKVFDLRVKDDRTLEIIPKSDFVTTDAAVLKTVKGSYKSAITVMVNDKPYTTDQVLTLSVDKKLPKVTVKAVKLNSFYADMQKLVITGGTVESVTTVGAPGWMTLDKNEMAIRFNLGKNNANQNLKASTKLNLKVQLKGWAIANDVKISVSAAPTVPKLKFTPATLTVNPLTGDTASAGWTITPAVFAEDDVVISKIMKGKDTQVNPDNGDPSSFAAYGLICEIDDGLLTVTTGEGFDSSKAWTFKVYLSVDGVEYPVTVKTLKAATPVTMAVKAAGSINLDIPLSPVKLTASIKNFNKGAAEYEITKIVAAGTTEDVQGKFNIEPDGNVITITADDEDLQAGSYEATVKATDADGEQVATQTVKFNVTRKPLTATVTAKAKGNIDVLRAASTSVVLTPSFKNCYIHDFVGIEVQNKSKASVTEKFGYDELEDGTVAVFIKEGQTVSHADKYTVVLKYKINDTETVIASKPVTLSVKQGKAAVSISSKAVKLFKNDRFSTGEVTIRITDPTLTGIKDKGIKLVSPKVNGVEVFELHELGNGVYAIAFKDNTPPNPNWKYKGGTAKIQVFLEGNETTKANVTFSVKVNVG